MASPLLDGLQNLEYRGYDSSGVGIVDADRGLTVEKQSGSLDDLVELVSAAGLDGRCGIAHTRWSTHGPATMENAHPHTDCSGKVAVVHNGIIENYRPLREDLRSAGHRFTSETDTEVIPHLIEDKLEAGLDHADAVDAALQGLEGSFAIAIVFEDRKAVYASRRGSPLVLGLDANRYFIASDVPSFLEYTDRVVYLEDGDIVEVTTEGYTITDPCGPVDRSVSSVDWKAGDATRDGFSHYMLKEIHEQPNALSRTIQGRVDESGSVTLEGFQSGTFNDVTDVHLFACGTSYHAALYAQQLLVAGGVPAYVHRAGEFASNPHPLSTGALAIAVTQSGETADTLKSIRRAKEAGARSLAVTNVVGSTAARESDETLFIRAGPEIGVAATKTFSSQVATLSLLSDLLIADATDTDRADGPTWGEALGSLPDAVFDCINDTGRISTLVDRYLNRDAYFFIGRGTTHPVALEGALKFKEITYEHAEGFSASQLKHGPLALVTADTPVFAVFGGTSHTKLLSNVEEVLSRGAPVVAVAPAGATQVRELVDNFVPVPETHPALTGVLANVQLQLFSYHVADELGRSIDKPRNLAKSVTVD